MIEVRGLSKTYADGKRALESLDLDLDEGMFGLLGPNGAGKTTFISMLVLAVEPTRGSRVYDGLDAARASNRSAIRGKIGYLPQDFAPISRLTGLEYLIHCARLRQVPLKAKKLEERCRQLLEAVALTHAANRFAGEYSGGMKRRLGIAQALVHSPRLVVVDEPTSGLDPEERIRFRNLITEVSERRSVLLSTHIVEDIEATCPRIGIIGSGRLLFEGPPSELLRRFHRELWEVRDGEPLPEGAVVAARRRGGDGEVHLLVHSRAEPRGARPADTTLEDAYSAFLALQGIAAGEEGA